MGDDDSGGSLELGWVRQCCLALPTFGWTHGSIPNFFLLNPSSSCFVWPIAALRQLDGNNPQNCDRNIFTFLCWGYIVKLWSCGPNFCLCPDNRVLSGNNSNREEHKLSVLSQLYLESTNSFTSTQPPSISPTKQDPKYNPLSGLPTVVDGLADIIRPDDAAAKQAAAALAAQGCAGALVAPAEVADALSLLELRGFNVCQCQDQTMGQTDRHTSAGMALAMARAAKVRENRVVSCMLVVGSWYLQG